MAAIVFCLLHRSVCFEADCSALVGSPAARNVAKPGNRFPQGKQNTSMYGASLAPWEGVPRNLGEGAGNPGSGAGNPGRGCRESRERVPGIPEGGAGNPGAGAGNPGRVPRNLRVS